MSKLNPRLRREEIEKEKKVANSHCRRTAVPVSQNRVCSRFRLYRAKKSAGTADQEAREYREAFTINKEKEDAEANGEITSDNGHCFVGKIDQGLLVSLSHAY